MWTYAVGLSDNLYYEYENCPCAIAGYLPLSSPLFVGENYYYCESGNVGMFDASVLYSDALWDGEECLPDNSCCDRTGQPWFFNNYLSV